jgi:sugar phosphate isomerase/epimerase
MDWSFQLYSARNFQPWSKVLKTLAAAGYRNVEGFGGLYGDAAGLRAELDANGLSMPSGHFSLDMLEGDFDGARKVAETLGIKLVACPHIAADLRPADAAGWRAFGERLGKVGKRVADAGFEFAWHNHDFEFAKLPDGSVPEQHIMDAAPNLGWEIDVAWVIRGGADPLQWIDRYGDRILAVHVKDIAPAGEATDEDGWADVGHGTVDWAGLIKALRSKTKARYYVVEHDNPNDFERFAKRSIEAAKRF